MRAAANSEYNDLVEIARLQALEPQTGHLDIGRQEKFATELISERLRNREGSFVLTVAASTIAKERCRWQRKEHKLRFNESQQKWNFLDPYCRLTIGQRLDVLVKDALAGDWLVWRERQGKNLARLQAHVGKVDRLTDRILALLPAGDRTEVILPTLIAEMGAVEEAPVEDDTGEFDDPDEDEDEDE